LGIKSQITGDLIWQGNEDSDPSPKGNVLNLAQVPMTSSK